MANANSGKGRGGDRIIESRHLVGLFLGVVILCGVFFTLGYVMGRTQYSNPMARAVEPIPKDVKPSSSPKTEPVKTTTATDSPEWDFYSSKKPDAKPETPAPVPAVASRPEPPASGPKNAALKEVPAVTKTLARYQPPRIPHGAILLQIAALRNEDDALALADALQQKQFPAFVVSPTSDRLYHVQVGPYADPQSANVAKLSLDRKGFKAIIKR